MENIKVLSLDDVRRIHTASLSILEETGARVQSMRALKMLEKVGASVDYQTKLVRVPSEVVEEFVRKAPNQVLLSAPRSENSLRIGCYESVYFCCGGASPQVIDLSENRPRSATSRDVVDAVRLADHLPNVKAFWAGAPISPQDVPQQLRDLIYLKLMLENTEKHCGLDLVSSFSARYSVKMAAAVVGGKDELRENAIISCYVNPHSPLNWTEDVVETIFAFAELHLPIDCCCGVLSGLTAPATLAGTLCLANAESLFSNFLAQLISPGAPVSHCCGASVSDVTSGKAVFSGPDQGLLAAAAVQMAKHYGLPVSVNGIIGDSDFSDIQSGYEKMVGALLSALSGAERITCLGLLSSSMSFSYRQLVIDEEIAGIITHCVRGIRVDEEALSLDIIRKVGVAGNYLRGEALKHTAMRAKREHWIPDISVRSSRSANAGKTILQKAEEKTRRILAEQIRKLLDRETSEELESIIKEAAREINL